MSQRLIPIEIIDKIILHDAEYVCIPRMHRDTPQRSSYLYKDSRVGQPFYDYVRYRILGQCVEEVVRNGVRGVAAEAGVYCGMFALKINELLPDRKLYLYDTFAGFDERDIEVDPYNNIRDSGWYNGINNLSQNTDLVEYITSIVPHPENLVFRKGYFPDTAEPDNLLRFCFVSLDLDLYKPTLAALEFFWPRMNNGGYIFIHDGKFEGVQQAIKEYEDAHGLLPKVPICDQSESYILCKTK